MHDCLNTKEQLVDLVFDELDQETRRRVLLELESCPDCQAHYQSMIETLSVVDQAVEMAMPDERYWPGYEAGLRTRLRQERPNLTQRLADWLGGFGFLTARPLQLAAGMALALLSIGLWWNLQRQPVATHEDIAIEIPRATTTPQPEIEPPGQKITDVRKPGGISYPQKRNRPITGKPEGGAPSVPREELGGVIVANNFDPGVYDQPRVAGSIFTPEAIRHFEKSQLLLLSFRNTKNGSAEIDLTYEKELSQRLLYQNILLRREAELKGILPAEEALGELEPFLLDIANLPDKPAPEELSDIRERLQRKEMIATLQIYSAYPSLPTYQNQ
ncbi:MAG: hypothetical protein L0220_01475 [Acidobacteria bacterium]|nr:hypothetical protein [Acidobacteriota bacterium]